MGRRCVLYRNAIGAVCLLAVALMLGSAEAADVRRHGELNFGLIPEENIFRLIKRHKPLEAYLSSRLGLTVHFTILSRYPDIIDRFSSRNLDGAFFGIFTAALAHENLGVEPLARPVASDGGDTAEGCIFVRRDAGIQRAEQMRGRRVAFVDMATATGYIYAIAYLREHGITEGRSFFSEEIFTGSHESALYTVLAGRADVGVAKCRIIDKMSTKDPLIDEELTVIARSGKLPDNTLAVRGSLPPEIKKALLDALLDLEDDPAGQAVLESLDAQRFVPASWDDFAPVLDLLRRAGVNIRNYKYK
jgi:phosphonate transport system substrate-binding protein